MDGSPGGVKKIKASQKAFAAILEAQWWVIVYSGDGIGHGHGIWMEYGVLFFRYRKNSDSMNFVEIWQFPPEKV